VGDAIVIEPGARKAKIRGLERHGVAVERTESGARIAVNLQGVGTDEIGRGDLLTEASAVLATTTFDASLRWIARKASLEDAASVELLTGTAERRARVALIGEKPIGPGERGLGRIHVDGPPLPLLPGDRFVLRGFARDAGIGSTLGGGIVLDVAPPHRRRRDPDLASELTRMARGDETVGLELRIQRAGLRGMTTGQLALETGLDAKALDDALALLVESDIILRVDASLCLGKPAAERLMADLLEAVESFHVREPLQPGIPRAALIGTLPDNVSSDANALLLKLLASRNDIAIQGEIVTRVGFESSLDVGQSKLADQLREQFGQAGLDAPALRTIAEDSRQDESRLREIAHYLEREGVLVAAPDDLFFDRASVVDLIDRVVAHFESMDELDTQTLKALIGTSRRTAMPLMALLDDLQITRRDGSIRRLIGSEPRW